MRKQKQFLNKKGIVLIASFMIIVVLAILSLAMIARLVTTSRATERYATSVRRFYLAEAGMDRALYVLKQDFEADQDLSVVTVSGVDYITNQDPTIYNSVALGSGTYTVDLIDLGAADSIRIRSTGTAGGISQTIFANIQITGESIWDNAIFAGAGGAGGMINGNVDIRGSVHILGTGLDPMVPAIALAIEMIGAAQIGNNYDGMPPELRSKTAPIPIGVFGGEVVETLSAELRVRRGIISLSGNASVGDEDAPGNELKETMDGVYVEDGFQLEGNADVYTDNDYINEGYDLETDPASPAYITFPSLNDPYEGYATRIAYFNDPDNALVIDDIARLDVLSNLTPASNFNYTDGVNGISMDGAGSLAITGNVRINVLPGDENADRGSLCMGGGAISYSGSGTILVGRADGVGSVKIDASLVTPGDNSFPNNIIAIMTPNDMTIGTTAQVDVMGIFYAEDTIATNKQTDVAGSFVSNYFDMTGQVPSIYYVDGIADNLPMDMIGREPISYNVEIIAWQAGE